MPDPAIGINDVLIRVHKTGICGTDLHIDSWDPWAAKTIKPPLVVGHEFVGEIVEVGSNVTDFHAGRPRQRRGPRRLRPMPPLPGRAGATCAPTRIGLGVGRDGAFAEYVALPMTNIWHHGPGIDEEVAAIFDPFGNAVHTALAFPVLGEDVLVSGAGPIGLMATAVVAARRRAPRRRHRAQRLPPRARDADGRHHRRSTRASATSHDVQRELGMVEGFDVALEMSGNRAGAPDGASTTWPMAAASRSSGIPTDEIALDVNEIVFKMLTLRGIYGREMYETWYKMTVMLQSGLDIRPAITHRFGVPRLRGRLRGGPLRRLGQGHHGLDAVHEHADRPAPIRSAFLDDELAALRERSTCTGRSGS